MNLPHNHQLQLGHLDAVREARRERERRDRERSAQHDSGPHATNSDIERVAGVIETWQRRHVGQMDADPAWAARNLTIDLANAGEVTALPASFAKPLDDYDDEVWESPGIDDGHVAAVYDGTVAVRYDSAGAPAELVCDPDDADALAAVLRAAAARARRRGAAYYGEQ